MATTNAHAAAKTRPYIPRRYDSARTRTRFISDRRALLLEHLHGVATYPQLLLIERVAMLEWEIGRRMAQPDRTEHMSREVMAMHNHLRLSLVALGLHETPPPPPKPIGQLAREFEASEAATRRRRSRQGAAA
jgi:hypothetical protein